MSTINLIIFINFIDAIIFIDIIDVEVIKKMLRFRLKELRDERGISQAHLAKAVGVGQSTVGMWESGKSTPEYNTLIKIADYFQVSVDYLTGKSIIRETNKIGSVKIPVLGSIPAGIPLEAIEDIVDYEEIPSSMGAGGKKYFALEVKGDSMYPEFLPGDRVVVLLTDVCSSGDVCVVRVNGYEATLKRVRIGPDRSLTLEPRNPEYSPRTYTPEEIENLPVSIAGVVVELRRKVK